MQNTATNLGTKSFSSFPERLNQARKKNNLTRQDLASMIGRSESTISRYERGECAPSFGTAAKISDALGVSINWLFD